MWRSRKLVRNPRFLLSAIYLFVLIVLSIVGTQLFQQDPFRMVGAPMQGPGEAHLLGTDELGRDLLSRTLYGARASLAIAVGSVIVASTGGIVAGGWAAYQRGVTELVLMQVVDMMLSLPALLLGVTTAAFIGRSIYHIIGVLGFVYFPHFARIAHSTVLATRGAGYVEAGRALGVSDARIFLRHILPNILAPLLIQGSLTLAYAMRLEATLSFLGLGPPLPLPSWGRMVSLGSKALSSAPHLLIAPVVALALTILAINMLGDALRDALDPKLRSVE